VLATFVDTNPDDERTRARFTEAVAKSVGIPAALVTSPGGSWVGFVDIDKDGLPHWNNGDSKAHRIREEGEIWARWRANGSLPEGFVALSSATYGADPVRVRNAIALAIAMHGEWRWKTGPAIDGFVNRPSEFPSNVEPRRVADRPVGELLEMAVAQHPACLRIWWPPLIGRTPAERRHLVDLMLHCTAEVSPDFAYTWVTQAATDIKDVAQQHLLWEVAIGTFQHVGRLDLAARVRMQQGMLWERRGRPTEAGQCYQEVYQRYALVSRLSFDAVEKAEALLKRTGRAAATVALYRIALEASKSPEGPAGATQLRNAYAEKLEAAGRTAEAEAVRSGRDVTGATR
jgi:hypothetical protein